MKSKLAIAVLSVTALGACTRVPAGYVGVKVEKYGSNSGVQKEALGVGTYFTGWNTEVYTFPTFTQNYVWTHSANEGKAADESISFQTADGPSINADFGITYHINPDDVPRVFQKYQRGIDEITDIFLRNMVRDALNEIAGSMSLDTISTNKAKFMDAVNVMVIKNAAASGITVERISLVGNFRYPEQIQQAMNAKMAATQRAMQIENEVASTKAEAEKAVVKSAAEVQVATNEAKAMALRGEAIRANPQILQQAWIDKWDGHVPPSLGNTPTMLDMRQFGIK